MNQSIKTSHGIAAIAGCLLIALAFINQTTEQPPVVADISEYLEPQTLLAQAAQSATLAFSPPSNSVTVGTQFTVNIILNTGGQGAYGVDFNRLRFNKDVLEIVGTTITPGSIMPNIFLNTVDNVNGNVQYSYVIPPESQPFTGSGTVASIVFRAKAPGTSNVTFDFAPNNGADTNVAGLGVDLLSSVGTGTYTVTSAVTDTVAPTAPGTPVASVFSASQINLTWPASTDNVGVANYTVERCEGASCVNFTAIGTPTANSFSNTGLTANVVYRYRVRANDAAGNPSTYSAITNATIDTTPPAIINQGTPTITTNSITITWTTSEPADTQVNYGLTSAYTLGPTTRVAALTLNHSVTLTGLQAGTSYHYQVLSRDAAGNLASSNNTIVPTAANADTTDPTVPTGLNVSPTSETTIQLTWTASTDPAGAGQTVSGVAGYQIYRNNVLLTTTPNTNFLDTGLTGATAYSYQITAYDSVTPTANVSARSPAVVGTTPSFSLAVQRRITLILEGAPASKRAVSGTIEYINPATNAVLPQSASLTTDALGTYTLDVASGLLPVVNMRAVIPGYLSKVVTNVDLRNTTQLPVNFPQLLAGNLNAGSGPNKDQVINAVDYSIMNTSWGTADATADLNKDGTVNTLDFAFIAKNYFAVGE